VPPHVFHRQKPFDVLFEDLVKDPLFGSCFGQSRADLFGRICFSTELV
jgi:hypothetical protein